MSEYKIGFIGAGNMGGTLAAAACRGTEPCKVLLSDHFPEKAAALAEKLGCRTGDNDGVAGKCGYIFLAVKPQMLAEVAAGIAPALKARQDRFVIVTMAAGTSISDVTKMLGMDCPVIRIMPNTPAFLGAGMILYDANSLVTGGEIADFLNFMSGAGVFDRLDEGLIDAGSAVSGCGPAYVYMFIEALADGGVQCGLPRDKAQKYAAQMVLGSAKMVLESGSHPGALKDAVCSPGGTTIVGVHALEDGGFRSLAMDAVTAAYEKTLELGKK